MMMLHRKTQQRGAIRRALSKADRPLSPREILDSARDSVPGLGIATVYRNVKALLGDGWLRTVDLPGAPSRYEVAGKDHHHHFHCRSCDRVYEVEECPGSLRDIAPRGFELDSHEIILYGTCESCAGA
jgi:Fur family transcriptional regulator, ferric uptake regulator